MADKKKEKGAKTPRNVESIKKLYRMEGSRMVRQRRECPKCGAGVFMAQHADRVACGRCGYTEFKKA